MMKFPRVLTILALLGLAFGGPVMAQGKPQAKPQAGQNETAQLMQSYREKNQQLQGIQQETIKNNPKLKAEMEHFQDEMMASMKTHGYDVKQGQARVQAMIAKMKSGKKMSKAERTSTMQSFQAEREKMMKARAASMKDPKIVKDRKALSDHMISAMKKQDKRTDQLLKDVKTLRAKIMTAMRAQQAAPKKAG